ncbi:MAG: peptide chain release factor N(5)-glutamine methyltransferase [Bdellovibrionales bacterium]|nr:peptide chain release factor N(5)-glutamine methyltransferase [Bdellovibrionales bacterium]
MLKLKNQIRRILSLSKNKKSVDAETDLILFHFFRDKYRDYPAQCEVTPEIEKSALAIARRRSNGDPLQHILGYQFFYEHEYKVDPHVLIPRPETEILVQAAINWARHHGCRKMAELGLGSGVISGEILFECKGVVGLATEISPDAIRLAKGNLATVLGPDWNKRIDIIQTQSPSQAFDSLLSNAPFDLIVSNPPYVSRTDEIEEEVLRHEPHLALFPDIQNPNRHPNFFYENFLKYAPQLLERHGAAFFEVPHERAGEINDLFSAVGQSYAIELIPDLTGRPRVLKVTFI